MCQKQSYDTKRIAKQSATAIKCKGAIGPRDWLNPYFCKVCQKWHLSKMTGWDWFNRLK